MTKEQLSIIEDMMEEIERLEEIGYEPMEIYYELGWGFNLADPNSKAKEWMVIDALERKGYGVGGKK